MSIHDHEPMMRTAGLQDGCARCVEHADHPLQTLDRGNLRRLIGIAVERNRLANSEYTHLDLVAAAKVLTALEHAGHLIETDPEAVIDYFKRWGVYIDQYTLSETLLRVREQESEAS